MGLLDRTRRPVTGLLSSYPFAQNFALSSPAGQMPEQFVGMWASGPDGSLRPIPDQRTSNAYSPAVPASEQQIQMAQFIPVPLPGRRLPPGMPLPPPNLPPISLPPISLPPSIPVPLPSDLPIIIPLPLPRLGGDDPPRNPPSNPPRRRKKSDDVCEQEWQARDRACYARLRSKSGIAACKSRSTMLYGDCLAGRPEGRFEPGDFAHYH
ncbi:MAG: hypothetical protein JWN69_806 [Alphaproteobacteria bacterium]|nr:hypothetical protein [Alphaproteobacteria bacterium]